MKKLDGSDGEEHTGQRIRYASVIMILAHSARDLARRRRRFSASASAVEGSTAGSSVLPTGSSPRGLTCIWLVPLSSSSAFLMSFSSSQS